MSDKASLIDEVKQRVDLTRRGNRYLGLCPFHGEKTPSFHVFPDHYHCFGCGQHGDLFSWTQHFEGLSFIDSLKLLAQKYHVDASSLNPSPEAKKEFQQKLTIQKILIESQQYFVHHLNQPHGQKALDYLQGRGFSLENIRNFGFGYAPKLDSSGLVRHLRQLGFAEQDMQTASIANRDWDFFQDRIMVPVRDHHGKLIAFGGRSLGDEQPKYKNSRYDKKSVLFGMDRARKSMRDRGRACVVEGYLDTLQLWQNGFNEAVACQGTAFSEEHAKLLSSACTDVYLIFDGDSAGRKATTRILQIALNAPNLNFKAVCLPENEDPDSYVRTHGPDALEQLLKQSQDLLEFTIREKLNHAEASNIPALITSEFLPWIRSVANPIQRDFLLGRVAAQTSIPLRTLRESLVASPLQQQTPVEQPQPAKASKASNPNLPIEAISPLVFEMIGHLYLADPKEINLVAMREFIDQELQEEYLIVEGLKQLCRYLEDGMTPCSESLPLFAENEALSTELVNKIKEKEKAFQTDSREMQLTRLQLFYRQNKIKHKIENLKSQLSVQKLKPAERDEWQQIAKIVLDLMGQLKSISNELRI